MLQSRWYINFYLLYNLSLILPDNTDFELSFSELRDVNIEHFFNDNNLLVDRTVSGRGQQDGGIQVTFKNLSPSSNIKLIYLESLPWFMKPHYHTLQTHVRGNGSRSQIRSRDSIQDMYYRPAVDRVRGSHLEALIEVPPATTLTLSYDFEKAILRYTEYPPDANRGFDVASAIIKVLASKDASSRMQGATYMRTTTLLLYLPTPDFSMPYNVVCRIHPDAKADSNRETDHFDEYSHSTRIRQHLQRHDTTFHSC